MKTLQEVIAKGEDDFVNGRGVTFTIEEIRQADENLVKMLAEKLADKFLKAKASEKPTAKQKELLKLLKGLDK